MWEKCVMGNYGVYWFAAEFYSFWQSWHFSVMDLYTDRCLSTRGNRVRVTHWQLKTANQKWSRTLACQTQRCQNVEPTVPSCFSLWLGARSWPLDSVCRTSFMLQIAEHRHRWAYVGVVGFGAEFPLIYLVTPPSSEGVYEQRGRICKQQNNTLLFQFLFLTFGFFFCCCCCLSFFIWFRFNFRYLRV